MLVEYTLKTFAFENQISVVSVDFCCVTEHMQGVVDFMGYVSQKIYVGNSIYIYLGTEGSGSATRTMSTCIGLGCGLRYIANRQIPDLWSGSPNHPTIPLTYI